MSRYLKCHDFRFGNLSVAAWELFSADLLILAPYNSARGQTLYLSHQLDLHDFDWLPAFRVVQDPIYGDTLTCCERFLIQGKFSFAL